MGIKTKKQEQIRARYLVNESLYTDTFYTISDGVDSQESTNVYIITIHRHLVTPVFASWCLDKMQPYLYQSVEGLLLLIDMEYTGQDLYFIYKGIDSPLKSLDLYINTVKSIEQSTQKRYQLLVKVAKVLLRLESKALSYDTLGLNTIFVTEDESVILGPARLSSLCLEYFYKSVDHYEPSIFLSPEFLTNFKRTTSSDIYSFGVLAYYIVSLKWPYSLHDPSIIGLKQAMMNGPVDCQKLNPKMSDHLNFFIMKSLSMDPRSRWGSFQMIVDILLGKEVVKFETLSHQTSSIQAFKSDITFSKNQTIKKYVSWALNGIAAICLLVAVYWGYSSYFGSYEIVQIPPVSNQSLDEVRAELNHLALKVSSVTYQFHPSIQEGQVVRLDPPTGRRIKQGRSVRIFVSKGRQERPVPSLVNKTLSDIDFILQGSSISVNVSAYAHSTAIEKGRVISQVPMADQFMFDDGIIQLILSKGVPVTVDEISFGDPEFKKLAIQFVFDESATEHSFDIVEKTAQNERQSLYSGIFYPDDQFEKTVIIHHTSTLIVALNGTDIYEYPPTDAN